MSVFRQCFLTDCSQYVFRASRWTRSLTERIFGTLYALSSLLPSYMSTGCATLIWRNAYNYSCKMCNKPLNIDYLRRFFSISFSNFNLFAVVVDFFIVLHFTSKMFNESLKKHLQKYRQKMKIKQIVLQLYVPQKMEQ